MESTFLRDPSNVEIWKLCSRIKLIAPSTDAQRLFIDLLEGNSKPKFYLPYFASKSEWLPLQFYELWSSHIPFLPVLPPWKKLHHRHLHFRHQSHKAKMGSWGPSLKDFGMDSEPAFNFSYQMIFNPSLERTVILFGWSRLKAWWLLLLGDTNFWSRYFLIDCQVFSCFFGLQEKSKTKACKKKAEMNWI